MNKIRLLGLLLLSPFAIGVCATDIVFTETKNLSLEKFLEKGFRVEHGRSLKDVYFKLIHKDNGFCDSPKLQLVVFDDQSRLIASAHLLDKQVDNQHLFRFSVSEEWIGSSRLDIDCGVPGGQSSYVVDIQQLYGEKN